MDLTDPQKASRDQFDRQSDRYGRSHILADTTDIQKACEWLSLPQPAEILDVATGGGHTANYFAGLGHRVVAADISPAMLKNAGNLAEEDGHKIETRLHSAEELPYEDSAFDLVTCRVAAHHFGDVKTFVRESARVLRPGGWFLIIDGSVPDGNPIAEEWTHRVEKLRDPSHGRFLSPSNWESLCAEAGFEVIHCQLNPMQMPDLQWYFETANTSPENRTQVLDLVANAPSEARDAFRIETGEDGTITWWWKRLTLVARKG